MIEVSGRKVCLGCIFVYPSTAVTLIVLLIITSYIEVSYLLFLGLAVLTFLINLLRFFKIKNKSISIILRIDLGISLGLAVYTVWIAPIWIPKLLVIYLVLQVASIYIFFRGLKALRICENCDRHNQFPNCSESIVSDH
jgi:hypothetical protein